jgi:hypothetical protein
MEGKQGGREKPGSLANGKDAASTHPRYGFIWRTPVFLRPSWHEPVPAAEPFFRDVVLT